MLILRASLAHSHFRIERLLIQIRNIVPQVNSIHAEFIYLIDLKNEQSTLENRVLSNLLHSEHYLTEMVSETSRGTSIFVVPKPGTISTWSREATNIAKLCGMFQVQRIERGIVYTVKASEKLTWGDEQAIANLLYDSRGEAIFYRFLDLKDLFQVGAAKPIQWIDVLTEERKALIKANEKNAAIIEGRRNGYFFSDKNHIYHYHPETIGTVVFSTLNHTGLPVGIGEILKIESAIKRGARPTAGFCGFNTVNLRILKFLQPWEIYYGKPKEVSSILEIMLEVPQKCAQLNNAFGCPTLCGYFRTYEQRVSNAKGQWEVLGYFNPQVLSGGMGSIRPLQTSKPRDSEIPLFNKQSSGFVKGHSEVFYQAPLFPKINLDLITMEEAIFRLLKFPCIADKSFLIHICDRSVTGSVVRDPMVGPWQVPVADCAATVRGFDTYQGEAMAIGERSPLAHINLNASARMAVGEAITNIAAANIGTLSEVRLIINAEASLSQNETENIHEAIETIRTEFCPVLGITIMVNQTSEPQQVVWQEDGEDKTITAPLSLVVNAFAPVMDVRFMLTPLLTISEGETVLIFIDLSGGYQRLGGSSIAQVFNQIGDEVPNVEDPKVLKSFFEIFQQLHVEGKILAYHDRSDGGLFITLCEMAFASHIGLKIDVSELGLESKAILFNEELGAVVQVRAEDADFILREFQEGGVSNGYVIGTLDYTDHITIIFNEEVICSYDRIFLQETWSLTSFYMQSLRDNPRCAKKQYEAIKNREDPGLNVHLTFDPEEDITTALLNLGARPRVAILREQGTHGHIEMAAAFDRAQFECVDVHMSDLQNGAFKLEAFKGLAVCGGFSFGDVLGAGQGWAKRILFNSLLREQFEDFFNREDTFTLGLSNGCQMLSYLKELIPGAIFWPHFIQNYSEQFESRLCLVEVQNTKSIFLKDMGGSRLLVPVAHKEGRVKFAREEYQEEVLRQALVALHYVDNWGRKTNTYPANPNGSSLGITGLTTPDGRVLIMMPYPDRAFRAVQYSWRPDTWGENAPWLRLFRNARRWV